MIDPPDTFATPGRRSPSPRTKHYPWANHHDERRHEQLGKRQGIDQATTDSSPYWCTHGSTLVPWTACGSLVGFLFGVWVTTWMSTCPECALESSPHHPPSAPPSPPPTPCSPPPPYPPPPCARRRNILTDLRMESECTQLNPDQHFVCNGWFRPVDATSSDAGHGIAFLCEDDPSTRGRCVNGERAVCEWTPAASAPPPSPPPLAPPHFPFRLPPPSPPPLSPPHPLPFLSYSPHPPSGVAPPPPPPSASSPQPSASSFPLSPPSAPHCLLSWDHLPRSLAPRSPILGLFGLLILGLLVCCIGAACRSCLCIDASSDSSASAARVPTPPSKRMTAGQGAGDVLLKFIMNARDEAAAARAEGQEGNVADQAAPRGFSVSPPREYCTPY